MRSWVGILSAVVIVAAEGITGLGCGGSAVAPGKDAAQPGDVPISSGGTVGAGGVYGSGGVTGLAGFASTGGVTTVGGSSGSALGGSTGTARGGAGGGVGGSPVLDASVTGGAGGVEVDALLGNGGSTETGLGGMGFGGTGGASKIDGTGGTTRPLGTGGVAGTGGAIATGGTTSLGGTGGTTGRCSTSPGCTLINDCCNCVIVPTGTPAPVSCTSECKVNMCSLNSEQVAQGDVGCWYGFCAVLSDPGNCNAGEVQCHGIKPTCPAGYLPAIVDKCWGPCVLQYSCVSTGP